MRRSRRYRPEVGEVLEARDLPSAGVGHQAPLPTLPTPRTDPYAVRQLALNLWQATALHPPIVFLGDSIPALWPFRGSASWRSAMVPRGAVDFGILGDTTGNVLAQIGAGELRSHPQVVVLMIGVNNLEQGDSPAQVFQGVAADIAAIRAASPGSHVVLMGLLPTAGEDGVTQTRSVSLVNTMIARLNDGTHVTFVNMGDYYLLPDGSLNPAMFVDGVHPNALGYTIWASQVSEVLDVLTGRAKPEPVVSLTPPPAAPPTLPLRHHRRHPHR